MDNLKDIINNYTKEEKSAFALGVLYSHARDLKKEDLFADYKIEEIMEMMTEKSV